MKIPKTFELPPPSDGWKGDDPILSSWSLSGHFSGVFTLTHSLFNFEGGVESHVCHGQKSRFFGDGHPTLNRNPYNGHINPYYWVDFYHPLLYGNNGSLDPSTNVVNLTGFPKP